MTAAAFDTHAAGGQVDLVMEDGDGVGAELVETGRLAGGVVTVAAVPGLLDDPAPEDGADADATPEETAGEAKGEAKA